MIIYSMTATFGKLEHETLTLQPGLNLLQAPNEWGKSTWCAFLSAMLYGIETRVHSTKTAIVDKERYAPWSGSPMSGRIELNWNGRDITIERSSKGRSIFGVFRAYETETGLDVPELTAANCGQMLLGVEKSVFLRSGFIRLSDMPVTQDEALRRRLNAIVTTGDESGTADSLAQKLKDLKNRCRLNRSNGLLPQAEAQQQALQNKLTQLQSLQAQSEKHHARLEQLEQRHRDLLNHRDALAFEANRTYAQKLAAAEAAEASADAKATQLQAECEQLPASDAVELNIQKLRQLRTAEDSLRLDQQLVATQPELPLIHPAFQNTNPEIAVSRAQAHLNAWQQMGVKEAFPWLSIVCLLLAIAAAFIPHWIGIAAAIALTVAAGAILIRHLLGRWCKNRTRQLLADNYPGLSPEEWISAARQYAAAQADYRKELEAWQREQAALSARAEALRQEIYELTQGRSLSECEAFYTAARESYATLAEAIREQHRTKELVQALRVSYREAPPPAYEDALSYSEQETARLISDCADEQRQLTRHIGDLQGSMRSLGQETVLRQQLEDITRRIAELENTYAALDIAQKALTEATNELQRRFAPRITQRAQELFGRLTGGRYTKMTLDGELAVHALAQDEDTLHSALWRSEGTVDQLYLALRLAVAEELIPTAPLVLDDALVRFDDTRLAEALRLLQEAAQTRQVILFTCQSREQQILS